MPVTSARSLSNIMIENDPDFGAREACEFVSD